MGVFRDSFIPSAAFFFFGPSRICGDAAGEIKRSFHSAPLLLEHLSHLPPSYLLPPAQGPVLPQQQADLGSRLHSSAASPLDGVMRLRNETCGRNSGSVTTLSWSAAGGRTREQRCRRRELILWLRASTALQLQS